MLSVSIPGRGHLELQHLVLDVNGTLAVDGVLIEGIAERLERLRDCLEIHMITADTHGKQAQIDQQLGITARRMEPSDERYQKFAFVNTLGHQHTVAIGNGSNDAWMLQGAALGIAVLGAEGLSGDAAHAADIIAPSIIDALDLLLIPKRLVATLRR